VLEEIGVRPLTADPALTASFTIAVRRPRTSEWSTAGSRHHDHADAAGEQRDSEQCGRSQFTQRHAERPSSCCEHDREHQPGGKEACPAGEQRRLRADRDLDPEVRRPPDGVDGGERGPDLPVSARHTYDDQH